MIILICLLTGLLPLTFILGRYVEARRLHRGLRGYHPLFELPEGWTLPGKGGA